MHADDLASQAESEQGAADHLFEKVLMRQSRMA